MGTVELFWDHYESLSEEQRAVSDKKLMQRLREMHEEEIREFLEENEKMDQRSESES